MIYYVFLFSLWKYLIAIGTVTFFSPTVLADKNIILVRDLYGSIPKNLFKNSITNITLNSEWLNL